MRLFHCKHDYELIKHVVLPSVFEQMTAGDQSIKRLDGDSSFFFQKTVITYFKCKKCGKLLEKVVRS